MHAYMHACLCNSVEHGGFHAIELLYYLALTTRYKLAHGRPKKLTNNIAKNKNECNGTKHRPLSYMLKGTTYNSAATNLMILQVKLLIRCTNESHVLRGRRAQTTVSPSLLEL